MTTQPSVPAAAGADAELAAIAKHLRRQGLPELAGGLPDVATAFATLLLVGLLGGAASGILPWHGTAATAVSAGLFGFLAPLLTAGLAPAVVYALIVVVRSTPAVVKATVREAPVVLAVLVFLFLTADVWQFLASIATWRFVSVLILFALAATPVLVLTLAPLVADVDRFATYAELDDLRAAAAATPAARLIDHVDPDPRPNLGRRQRWNIQVALFVRLLFLVVTVASAAFAFFIMLGLVAFDRSLVQKWTDHPPGWDPHVVEDLNLLGHHLLLTAPLIRVAALLAAIAGLTFAVSVLREDRVRVEFAESECTRVKRLIAAWVYLTRAQAPEGS